MNKQIQKATLVGCLAMAASTAQAHIDLDQAGSHMSRYGASMIKQGPCGITGGTRGTNVYTYMPGEVISVSVKEFIGHPGYFRIAFDDDGDDGFLNPQTVDPLNRQCMADAADKCGASDFFNNDTVLQDNLDPHDYPPLGATPSYTWEVQLPNIECDNCTLQIIQVMTDPPGIHAPYDPSYTSDDVYYQCIDLVLKAGTPPGGVDPDGAMMNPPPAMETPVPGQEGVAGGAAPTPGGGEGEPAPAGTQAPVPGAQPTDQTPTYNPSSADTGEADGGCSVVAPGSSGGTSAAWVLLGLAAPGRLRRRGV